VLSISTRLHINLSFVVFFLLGDFSAFVFYMPTFRNTVRSIFLGGVSRKNNRDEILGVFIQERVWLA
jgi:hypothetical protein